MKPLNKKRFGAYKEPLHEIPNLVQPQLESFSLFLKEGLSEMFKEFSPISDYSGKKFDLTFVKYEIGEPQYDEFYAKEHKVTYEAPLRAIIRLKNKQFNSEKEQEIFLADIPVMTDHGTFIINGVERVIVPQLARSFGIFFTENEVRGTRCFGAKIIPARGAWIEIESEPDGGISVRIDRKRKFPITALLRVLGAEYDKDMYSLFSGNKDAKEHIEKTLEKDTAKTSMEAYVEIHKRLRDGDPATPENAKEYISTLLSAERYDISPVGRHRFNERFKKSLDDKEMDRRTLNLDDLVTTISKIIELNHDKNSGPDNIDHLGFRRVRYVGETLQQRARIGFSRMKRNIQDRMSTVESETSLPVQLINPRPLQAAIKEFFTSNQLSQFMSQQNLLAELEHLRRLSALGPGGLTRERAGFEVRDVHPSHYGRLCPIHTPEGPNIGLILHLSTFAAIDEFGLIRSPYMKVEKGKVTGEIVYLNGIEEEAYKIANSATQVEKDGRLNHRSSTTASTASSEVIPVRHGGAMSRALAEEVDFIDVSVYQQFSIAAGMIPFINHNDAPRALMGSVMQRQAVPCVNPEVPLVATGIEERAARDTGRLILSKASGEVTYVDAKKIVVKDSKGKEHDHKLVTFSKTNDNSAFYQRPSVDLGEKVKAGDVLADASSSAHGELALGQNCRVAFMCWSGSNYEDAIVISERLVKNSKFSTINIEEFEVSVRDTKLGPEVTTHDIPNVSETKLRNLDVDGIIRVGAEVRSGDILVGKVTPKGETQLTPEERLLRSIFGEKAKDVKDTSLRLEGGKRGRVIGVRVFSREQGDNLESGILKRVHVTVAQLRNISVGDKLAGRHGNKGVISTVLPEADMPYDKDGNPIDVVLTPLGVPSRMNLGQILELHLGAAAHELNYQAVVPPYEGATEAEVIEELKEAGLHEDGKMTLYDGRTGEEFDQRVAVGQMYILKLGHMVEDKIHMRSIGPYSLITQQPLGGKAQNGGQRFGEMEVWALLGYGAAHTLREVLTIKSDDISGRSAAFDAIVKGERITNLHTPAAFSVLLNHLRSLALDVELEKDN